jgi:hypothetical protein
MTAAATAAPARKCRLEGLTKDVLVLTGRGGEVSYHLSEEKADFGRTFVLRRFTASGGRGEVYVVSLGGARGNRDSCTCPDTLYRPQAGGCKHVCAARALVAAGRL